MEIPVYIQPKSEYCPVPYKSEVEVTIDFCEKEVEIEVNETLDLDTNFTITFNIEDLRKLVKEYDFKQ